MRTRKGRGQNYIKTLKEVDAGQEMSIEVKISPLYFAICLSHSSSGKIVIFFLSNFHTPART